MLVLDQDALDRQAFVQAASARGFLVDTAEGLVEAQGLAQRTRYPVIAISLPTLDRSDSEAIRALCETNDKASIVVLTALETLQLQHDVEVSHQLVAIVRKPYDGDELSDTLHRALRLWAARSTLPPPAQTDGLNRLLLVEDRDRDAELVQAYLAIDGPEYQTVRVRTLRQALTAVEQQSFDVLAVDLGLPDARGIDAVLRLQTVAAATPLLVLSGHDNETLGLEAVQAGAQDFLLKGSFDSRSLVRAIRYAQQRKTSELNLTRLANYDPLTGLANRSHFTDRLAHTLRRARRNGECFAVFYLDLDGFKAVNDSWGHDAGDALLVQVARRLKSTARESDLLARLGGDEFAAIIEGLNCHDGGARAAQRILEAVSKPYRLDHHEAHLTVSVGIAFYPEAGDTVDALVKSADQAMYEAKASGRNTYRLHSDKATQLASPEGLQQEFQLALEKSRFELYYQPLYSVRDACIVGAEGLLRWRRDPRRLLPPAEFLPLLEASQHALPAGEWVIHTACAQMASWVAERPDARVSVNLSARQLADQTLPEVVESALHKSNIPGPNLELEVSEVALLVNLEQAAYQLCALKELGVRLVLDDFGVGQAALACLHRLPIDVLKIDRSVIAELTCSERSRALLRGIIALSRQLDLTVVAEGVETVAERDFLVQEGCDVLQGYLFGHPMALSNFEFWAQHEPRTAPHGIATSRAS